MGTRSDRSITFSRNNPSNNIQGKELNIQSPTQTERDNERRRRKGNSIKHQDFQQQQQQQHQGYLDLDMMMLDGGGGLYHEQYDEHGVLIERPDI